MSRRTRIVLGGLMAAFGLVGVLTLGLASPVTAQPAAATAEVHEAMDAMMDAMHGPGIAEGMHRVPGGEEMMDQCAAMMTTIGGMMDGGMMGG